ncbi:hypothetical protein CPB85DRAFT_1441709 [Mucidula mucida]|nr:hypothetical protein CPB85DRAFT_1441709 [Mucidula mucida]
MSKRYATRSTTVKIDDSLLKRTRKEIEEAKQQKAEASRQEKQCQNGKEAATKAAQSESRRRVARAQDKQAVANRINESVRPDLLEANVVPSIQLTATTPPTAPPQQLSAAPPDPVAAATTARSPESPEDNFFTGMDDGKDFNGEIEQDADVDMEGGDSDFGLLLHLPPETESEGSMYGESAFRDDDSEPNDDPHVAVGNDDDLSGPLNPNYDSDDSDAYENDDEASDEEEDPLADDVVASKQERPKKRKRTTAAAPIIPPGMTPSQKEDYFQYLAWKQAQDAVKAKGNTSKKRKVTAAAKKVAKTSTRWEIESARDVPAKAPVQPKTVTGNKRKEAEPQDNNQQKKRSKANEQGGISTDWKKTINRYQTEAAASTTSLGEVVGEFDDVESPASLAAARALKVKENVEAASGEIKGGSKRQHRNAIAIIPADIKEIDGKERETPATGKRTVWRNYHLPVDSSELSKWQKQVMTRILDYMGSLKNIFAANSDKELRSIVCKEWLRFFGHLEVHVLHNGQNIVRADHPAILGVAQSNI